MHRQTGGLVQHYESFVPEQDRRHRGSLPEFVRDGKAVAGCLQMRIHIQNPVDDPLFLFSRDMWDAAVTRAPDVGTGHDVTIGDSDADFAAGIAEAEALITDVDVVAAKFPCSAPRLKLLMITSAGLDRLAPFDWVPQGAALLNNAGIHAAKAGEFAIMSILMLANHVPEMVTHQRAGRWQKVWGAVLEGRRVTVVGLGSLGGAAAMQAARFGMHVTGVRATPMPHTHCGRGDHHRRPRSRAATDRVPGARLSAHRCDPRADRSRDG